MKLYNTKTLQIEEFKPIKENEVSMYVCGPTVYNHAHIGNARPIVVFDTLRRVFEALGYKVKFVSNFTDVDDKIINKAKEEGVNEEEIAQRYIDAYNDVRKSLNVIPLDATPRVTKTMDEMIEFIKKLVDEKSAYEVDGEVYFSIDSIDSYGSLSHQNLDELIAGASERTENDEKKRNPLDFLLWKKTEEGIKWDSPWGKGRPGWHTECVVMINDEFGDGLIDIHGGGKDLRFPHHENEVAQCEVVHHHGLANYWLHNGMLNLRGGKMSKSEGNIELAKDVIKELGANVTRWLLLSVNYRDVLNYTPEAIETAQKEIEKISLVLKQTELNAILNNKDLNGNLNNYYDEFIDAMSDDLNTPNAYKAIFEIVKNINQLLRVKDIDYSLLADNYTSLRKMLDILGINIPKLELSDQDKELYSSWLSAKANKDFDKADEIRKELIEKGIL